MQKPTIKKMRSKKSKNASNKKNMRSKKTKKNNQRGGMFGKSTKSKKLNTSPEITNFTNSNIAFSELTEDDMYEGITDDMVKVFIDNFLIINSKLFGDGIAKKNEKVLQNIIRIIDIIQGLINSEERIKDETTIHNIKNQNITYPYGNNSEEDQFNLMILSLQKNYCVLRYFLSLKTLEKEEINNLKKIKYIVNTLKMQLRKAPGSSHLMGDGTLLHTNLMAGPHVLY